MSAIVSAITSFFDFVVDLAKGVGSLMMFLVKMVKDLVYIVGLFVRMIPVLPQMLTWLPPALLATLTVGFTIVIICRVAGRNS